MFCSDVFKIHTCYCTTAPCVHCVKMIKNTSCRRIVFSETYAHATESMHLWLDRGTIIQTHRMEPRALISRLHEVDDLTDRTWELQPLG
jgi:deoxycytidylate deaminase